jgi:fatty-acyl-CoA synthase
MYQVSLTQSHFPAIAPDAAAPITIGEMLRRQAAIRREAPALKALSTSGEILRVWSYVDLLADAERLGRALASRHAPGARIAVYANNCPEWVLLELGSAFAGIVLVTVNPASQRRELEHVLTQSRSEAIYCVESFRGTRLKAIADEACAALPHIRRVVLMTDEAAMFAGEDKGVLPEAIPADVVQIQYTSGTTGLPKGALLHHHGLLRNALDIMGRLGVEPGDVYLHHMPLFHTTGCAILVLGTLGVGGTLLLTPLFDPAVMVKLIERERPDYLLGVPTMVSAMIEQARGRALRGARGALSGGAMVSPELVRQAQKVFGVPIQIVYGQTECSPGITMSWPDDTIEDLTGTIGQPLPGVEVAILDPASGAILPIGEQGEICTRGYHVMTGYNDDPAATARTICPQGWLHTGDLGRMDARGYVRITGRLKEMIIRGGENIYPAEIENVLLEHEDIGEAAVVGVPCPVMGEQVACFLRPSGARRPEPDELKAFLRERLSPQKTPRHWIWIESWPLTGSGKIQKFVLSERFGKGEFGMESPVGPVPLSQPS